MDKAAAPANLNKKTGMPDEGDGEFSIDRKTGMGSLARERGHRGMPHQTPELRCSLAQSPVAVSCLNHPNAATSAAHPLLPPNNTSPLLLNHNRLHQLLN